MDLNYSLYISATPLQSVWTMPSMFCPGVWRKTRPVWNCGRIIWPCLPDTLTSRSWESCVRPPYSWPQATPSGGRYVHYNIHSSPQLVYCFLIVKLPTFIDIICKWYFNRFLKNFLGTHCNCCFGYFQYLGTIKSLHKKADTCDSILNFLKSLDAVDSELRSFWCLETVLYKMSLHCWSGKHKTAANFLQVGDNLWSVLCLVSLESSP